MSTRRPISEEKLALMMQESKEAKKAKEAVEKSWQTIPESLDEYIGVSQPLTSPFNIFLNINDIWPELKCGVRYIIYSTGAKRIVLWGIYNRITERPEMGNACRYGALTLEKKGPRGENVNKLEKFWNRNGFRYIGNTVKNQLPIVVAEKDTILNHPDIYRLYKYILAEEEKKIPGLPASLQNLLDKDFEQKTGLSEADVLAGNITQNEFDEEKERKYKQYVSNIPKWVNEYERLVNIASIDRRDIKAILPNLGTRSGEVYDAIALITDGIYDLLRTGRFYNPNIYDTVPGCPTESECEYLVASPNMGTPEEREVCGIYDFGKYMPPHRKPKITSFIGV